MPLIRMGAGFSQISGSISGNTFSRNRTGAYIRSKTVPSNPRSSSQNKCRSAQSQAAGAWLTSLSVVQRLSWDNFAKAIPVFNRLGQITRFSGQQHFIRANLARLTLSLPMVLDAPSVFLFAGQDPSIAVILSA